MPADTDWLSPAALDRYYEQLYSEQSSRDEMMFTAKSESGTSISLVDLLSLNEQGMRARAGAGAGKSLPDYALRQAFGTAEAAFRAIDGGGIGVLVPYGEGTELIKKLLSGNPPAGVFRELEAYAVQLSDSELKRLGNAVYTALDGAVNILQENYYDGDGIGVVFDPLPPNDTFV